MCVVKNYSVAKADNFGNTSTPFFLIKAPGERNATETLFLTSVDGDHEEVWHCYDKCVVV